MTAGLGERRGPARVVCIQADGDPHGLLQALRAGGMQATAGPSVEAALEGPGDEPVDLVVVDLSHCRVPVAELAAWLREHRRTTAAGVLAVTEEEERVRALVGLERGVDAYLVHPVDARRLLAQAHALLRIRWAERQARSLARDWRAAFDSITDAILVLTVGGEVTRCNSAALRIIGRSRDEVLRHHYLEAWPEAVSALPGDLPVLGSTTGPFSSEVSLDERWYRLAIAPIDEEEGHPEGDVVVVLTDITALKRYEQELQSKAQELQQQNRRQSEFLSLLAHELRNPLAAIASAAEVIGEGSETWAADEPRLALAVINRQLANLSRMVSDILDASRIAEGKVELRLEAVDLRDCVRAAIAAAAPEADVRGHTLAEDLGDRPLVTAVDRTRVEQMLANLIDNAIKYTEPGGHIEVTTAEASDGRGVSIRVRDDGVGMPPNRLKEAFGMFVQYERTLARAEGGLGLGLTLVKRLAALHGGRVSAESAGLGHGSTFEIVLPWRDTGAEAPPPTTPSAPPAVRRVLLVEDDEDQRTLLAWRLRRAGHEVIEATSGTEGLKRALHETPDAVILDVGLPELDGYALARALRARDTLEQTQLIALTGYGSSEDRVRALEAGIDEHLVKPVDLARLVEVLARGRASDAP